MKLEKRLKNREKNKMIKKPLEFNENEFENKKLFSLKKNTLSLEDYSNLPRIITNINNFYYIFLAYI